MNTKKLRLDKLTKSDLQQLGCNGSTKDDLFKDGLKKGLYQFDQKFCGFSRKTLKYLIFNF
jgi:hypothetical protein